MFSAKANSLNLAKVSNLGDRLEGSVELVAWTRLAAVMVSLEQVQVNLDLHRHAAVVLAEGIIELQGQIRCARCLGSMPFKQKVTVHAGLAEDEATVAALDSDLEPVLVEKGLVALQAWLEDEALLAMPMIPRCAEWQSGACPVSGLEPYCNY